MVVCGYLCVKLAFYAEIASVALLINLFKIDIICFISIHYYDNCLNHLKKIEVNHPHFFILILSIFIFNPLLLNYTI